MQVVGPSREEFFQRDLMAVFRVRANCFAVRNFHFRISVQINGLTHANAWMAVQNTVSQGDSVTDQVETLQFREVG